MSVNNENELRKHFGVSLPIAASLVAFGGLLAAGVLSAGHISKLPVPCGSSSGCVAVASHPSSKFAGIPIAFFGVVAYITILCLLMYLDRARWTHLALVAVTGVGATLSARRLFYAHFVIHATCYWCVASAVAMAILFVISICICRAKRRPRAVSAFFLGVGWNHALCNWSGGLVDGTECCGSANCFGEAVGCASRGTAGRREQPRAGERAGKNSHVFRSLVFGLQGSSWPIDGLSNQRIRTTCR
jgi:uncharacterized membrane protein